MFGLEVCGLGGVWDFGGLVVSGFAICVGCKTVHVSFVTLVVFITVTTIYDCDMTIRRRVFSAVNIAASIVISTGSLLHTVLLLVLTYPRS